MQILSIWYIIFHTAFLYCSWCSHSRYSWYTLPSKSCQLILQKFKKRKTCKVSRYGIAKEYSSHGQKLNIDDSEHYFGKLLTLQMSLPRSQESEALIESDVATGVNYVVAHLWVGLGPDNYYLLSKVNTVVENTQIHYDWEDTKIMLTFKIWICWRNPFTSPEASSLMTAWTFKCTTTSYQKLTKA